ncbi:hypothetical protein ACFV5N_07380 [Streptomyces sp. NPDC059853]|uniref:DUF7144 family membrane protein n=1 Tax=Streptomyces sp. NPDC059853 TaxID=3346973 RepID=UPI00365E5A0F
MGTAPTVRAGEAPSPGAPDPPPAPPGRLRYAGLLLTLLGTFHLLSGLTALGRPEYFAVARGGLMALDYPAWGLVFLLLGGAQLAAGIALQRRRPRAAGAAVAVVMVAAVGQAGFFAAFPLWSALIVGLCVLTLHTLCAPAR